MAGGSVYLESYGCQMNLADGELIAGHLSAHGYTLVDCTDRADVLLVNTCAIRGRAEERVLGRLAELAGLKGRKPGVKLGVCGCVAQRLKSALKERVPALDFVIGPDSYRLLPDLLGEHAGAERAAGGPLRVGLDRTETYSGMSPRRRGGVSAWVTVMRGCNRFCTFCIVPFVRGRERSRPAVEILAEVRDLGRDGFREVVFLGQTVTSYHDGTTDIAGLLDGAAGIEGIERIRFTSPHPAGITGRVIEAIAGNKKVSPQLHLPLQAGSDNVLERMNRNYGVRDYLSLVDRVRAAIPEIALSTDILVGFPGETDDDFRSTLAVMREVEFDHAFMFKYSPRPGTRAFTWRDTVSEEEKRSRLKEVIGLQEEISLKLNQRWVGREVEVLVEGRAKRQPQWSTGKTAQFKTTILPSLLRPGELVRATVSRATAHTLIAEAPAAKNQPGTRRSDG